MRETDRDKVKTLESLSFAPEAFYNWVTMKIVLNDFSSLYSFKG